MPTYEACQAIGASQDQVWRVLSNVTAWPEWLPTVSKVDPLDGDHLNIGSRFVVYQPKLRPATWVVTELAPPRQFIWSARSIGWLMVAEHEVSAQPDGTCRVTLRFSFKGAIGSLLGWAFGPLTRSYLAREAAALKHTAEALK
jgi:hypothetical protein